MDGRTLIKKRMKNTLLYTSLFALLALTAVSCKKKGCTDPAALNYNENATKDGGSCIFDPIEPSTVQRICYGEDDRQHFDLYIPGVHALKSLASIRSSCLIFHWPTVSPLQPLSTLILSKKFSDR